MFRGKGFGDGRRAICRSIVNKHQFPPGVGLGKDALDGFADICLTVQKYDYDGNKGLFGRPGMPGTFGMVH
jgi:hypothetical protein